MIGFSSWLMLPIRANANTTINENNPSSARELLAYYNREQYGDASVFYDKYYSANIMKLVLLSNESLDDLENKARTYFSTIEDKSIAEPDISIAMPDFAKKRVYFVPNNDVKQIRLDFVITTCTIE